MKEVPARPSLDDSSTWRIHKQY